MKGPGSQSSGEGSEGSDTTGGKRKNKKKGGNIAYYLAINEGYQPDPTAKSWEYYEVKGDVKVPKLVRQGGNQSSDEDTATEETPRADVMDNPLGQASTNGDVADSSGATTTEVVESKPPEVKPPPVLVTTQESDA